MVMYHIMYTKQALKDIEKLKSSHLSQRAKQLIDIIKNDPFQNPPPFEALVGNLKGAYSRRINIKHRLVYQVLEDETIVKIIRMWTHYE